MSDRYCRACNHVPCECPSSDSILASVYGSPSTGKVYHVATRDGSVVCECGERHVIDLGAPSSAPSLPAGGSEPTKDPIGELCGLLDAAGLRPYFDALNDCTMRPAAIESVKRIQAMLDGAGIERGHSLEWRVREALRPPVETPPNEQTPTSRIAVERAVLYAAWGAIYEARRVLDTSESPLGYEADEARRRLRRAFAAMAAPEYYDARLGVLGLPNASKDVDAERGEWRVWKQETAAEITSADFAHLDAPASSSPTPAPEAGGGNVSPEQDAGAASVRRPADPGNAAPRTCYDPFCSGGDHSECLPPPSPQGAGAPDAPSVSSETPDEEFERRLEGVQTQWQLFATSETDAERVKALDFANRASAGLRSFVSRLRVERDEAREQLYNAVLVARGIEAEDACKRCGGAGIRGYGSTATWRGGIGGQMITDDVCDKCWGSGSASRPWKSWREIVGLTSSLAEARAENERLTSWRTDLRQKDAYIVRLWELIERYGPVDLIAATSKMNRPAVSLPSTEKQNDGR